MIEEPVAHSAAAICVLVCVEFGAELYLDTLCIFRELPGTEEARPRGIIVGDINISSMFRKWQSKFINTSLFF